LSTAPGTRSDSSGTPVRPDQRGSSRGYFYIATATAFWGISATLGRAAFTGRLLPGSGIARVDPLILSQARTSFSFTAVLLGLLVLRGPRRLRLPLGDLGKIALLGLAGVAASNYFYYVAIQRTNVATAIIVQYTAPIWVLLYMVARRLERATWPKMLSVALALFGIALVIGLVGKGKLQLDLLGVIAALIAAFAFSYYNIFGHSILARYDRWTVLLFTTMAASLFWIVINPPGKIAAQHYSLQAWLFLVVFSMLSVLLPFTFYFAGLEYLPPTKAIVVSCLEPVFSILIAAVALHETVGPLQVVGIAMVLSAIVVVQRPSRGDKVQAVIEPVD
jgi:drug/metabolite transporter (DMT)-like permease